MEIFKKAALGSAVLLCLAQFLPGDAVASCNCGADTSAIEPYIEDMRWLTHGHVPVQTDELCPLTIQLECQD
ncbi:hypothetical protein DFP91_3041 [Pseudorhodoplanes sinuspersici]|uniref:Uncharacterized protein n=1 Tax=Pseudorhodoplanes sinuspersici TaxID=1235591 RepID=A0A1W6ZSU2_9HYPH|nr:hypothetical protein CAK95_12395 [Pseudorhodoplanes sinuspersici]RKE70794.1 hypothetical protein DFP91_3041 [Pseudorhodoplanes sinuspersici]